LRPIRLDVDWLRAMMLGFGYRVGWVKVKCWVMTGCGGYGWGRGSEVLRLWKAGFRKIREEKDRVGGGWLGCIFSDFFYCVFCI
jgi:hypothetical protein